MKRSSDALNNGPEFYVVQFIDSPFEGIDDFVCIPYNWKIVRGTEGPSVVTYPEDKDPIVIRDLAKRKERSDNEWKFYLATIKYESDSYEDAELWITSRKNCGVLEEASEVTDVQPKPPENKKLCSANQNQLKCNESAQSSSATVNDVNTSDDVQHNQSMEYSQTKESSDSSDADGNSESDCIIPYAQYKKQALKSLKNSEKRTDVINIHGAEQSLPSRSSDQEIPDRRTPNCQPKVENVREGSDSSKISFNVADILDVKNSDPNTSDKCQDSNVSNKSPKKFHFILPLDYDPYDTKWTLKHRTPPSRHFELIPGSDVYIPYQFYRYFKVASKDCKSLALILLTEVFTYSALSVCSTMLEELSGDTNNRPNLDEDACSALIDYTRLYGLDKGWNTDLEPILSALHNKMLEIRSKYGEVYEL